jgi:hypothetical protein
MGPRNLLILFFSTVAVSLVILIIFFSLFFKNVDLNFNTRLPESAPDIGRQYASGPNMNPDSKADGLMRSTVNVPPEMQEPAVGTTNAKKKSDSDMPSDSDLPPVSDDSVLEHGNTGPIAEPMPLSTPKDESTEVTMPSDKASLRTSTPPSPRTPKPVKRQTEAPPPIANPEPPPIEENAPSGPPVPGQQ